MVTQIAYVLIVAAVGAERLVELFIARRNAARQRERGGVEFGKGHYPFMVVIHAALLLGCPLEMWLADRPFIPALSYPMFALLLGSQALRYWVVATLGDRWTTRVIVVPGDKRITGGPFRFMTHPNYLAVVTEGFALPLIHTNWITALVFSTANAFVLVARIRTEDRALRELKA